MTLSETSVPSLVTTSVPACNKDDTTRAESLQNVVEGEKPSLSSVDKGKGKAAAEFPDNLISPETVRSLAGPSHESDSLKEAQAKIADLTAQLQVQKTLVSRHEDNLSHLQQSLTCEICLDLLYKPFALSPCGHVACYMCLIRWFTSLQNNGNNNNNNIEPPAEFADVPALLNSRAATRGDFLHNKKTCPLCRASIHDRPAEIWSIKSMVAHLVKSKLVDLPSEPPPSATETPPSGGGNNTRINRQNDPWRNVFPRPKTRGYHIPRGRQFFPPPPENNEGGEDEGWGVEEMGMYDAEDGGIYRCIECMHEIWGGVCTSCHREYPGHARFDDDDDDDDDGGWDDGDGDEDDHGGFGGNFLGRRLREIWRGYNDQAVGWADEDDEGEDEDEDDIDIGEFYDAPGDLMELTDDDDDGSMSEEHSDLDDDNSEGEWTSDEEGEGEVVYPGFMFNGFPMFPVHRRGRRAIEPEYAGHIEEVNGDFEDQEGEERDEDEEEQESEEDFNSDHSHPDSDYEDSFIDDDGIDEDLPGVAYGIWGGHNLSNRQIARQMGMAARLRGDSPPTPPAPGRRLDPRAAAAVAAVLRGNHRSGRRRESPIVVEDDNEEEEDGDDDDAWQEGPDEDYEDEDEDKEEEEGPEFECGFLTQNGRGRQRQVIYDVDEDEDDEDEEGQEIRPSGSRRRRGGNARAGPSGRGRRAHVVYDVDDEGSEID
ncbi:hypothetical protein AN958_11099 [Leucoagaricus sp. SymC.cos]|nr:hypothetical protein AN958_11099 [Leucoagaricus sp. SymC.cos]